MICSSCFFTKSRELGFTLVEMMIVIAIAAILAATAAPSFQAMVIRSNVESLQDDFANAVITARTEAASRGKEVRVCPLAGCSTSDWAAGWIIVTDSTVSGSATLDVLASFPNQISYPVTVHNEAGGAETSIAFDGRGYNATEERYVFAVCGPDATNPSVARGVTVERTGRAYHTEANGNHKKHKVSFDDGNGGATTAIDLKCTQA